MDPNLIVIHLRRIYKKTYNFNIENKALSNLTNSYLNQIRENMMKYVASGLLYLTCFYNISNPNL